MFIGHFAVGFASKRWAPRASLAVLLAAPLFADLLWPVLILAGVEKARIIPNANPFLQLWLDSIPWSHSLLMDAVWAALFAGAVFFLARDRAAALVVAAGVLSHWVLDWVTHRPDMPLYPGGSGFGLGLWNSISGTIIVEIVMFVVGVALYVRTTRAADRIGSFAFWGLVLLLALSYVAQAVGQAPPSMTVVAVSGIVASVVILIWAWWLDRHRVIRAPA